VVGTTFIINESTAAIYLRTQIIIGFNTTEFSANFKLDGFSKGFGIINFAGIYGNIRWGLIQ
jgi:hypothetical protein